MIAEGDEAMTYPIIPRGEDCFSYRRHLVRQTIHGWSLTVDGTHLGWAKSADDAKLIIDHLLA